MNIYADSGENFYWLAKRALKRSAECNEILTFQHNDLIVTVYPNSCLECLLEKYDLKKKIEQLSK